MQEDPKIYSTRPKYDVSGDIIKHTIETGTENDFLRAYRRSQGQSKNLDTGGIESFEGLRVNASGGASAETDAVIIDLTTGDPVEGKILFIEDSS